MTRIRRKLSKYSTAAAAVTTLFAYPHLVHADFYLHDWEDQFEELQRTRLDFRLGYYATTDNYNSTGTRVFPSSDFLKYSRIQTDALAVYGLFSRVSVFVRLSWANTLLEQGGLALSGKTMGLTDNSVGVTWRALKFNEAPGLTPVSVDLQVQADIPFYQNSSDFTGPALGDSTTDITTGAFLRVPVVNSLDRQLLLSAGAGLTLRSSSYSSAIPWSLTADYRPTNSGIVASMSFQGVESLYTDPRASLIGPGETAGEKYSQSTGGSFISGAIDPSILKLAGQLGYQFNRGIRAIAFASQSLSGLSAPNGLNVGLGFQARLGDLGASVKRQSPHNGARSSPDTYSHANQGFVNYGLEAHVTRSNDRLNLVKIDKGKNDGVDAGQVFDIFQVNKDGTVGDAIARGTVSNVLESESALSINEYFKEVWVDEGFVARRPIQ